MKIEMAFRSVLMAWALFVPSVRAATPQPFMFVVSVGGISVGDPVRAKGVWTLPVQADVSGLETFTSKPTILNSALVCSSVAAKITGNSIYLTIRSNLAGANKSARCPPALLGVIPSGSYKVFYQGPQEAPVFLRSIDVGI
jgi:hypothetical protein